MVSPAENASHIQRIHHMDEDSPFEAPVAPEPTPWYKRRWVIVTAIIAFVVIAAGVLIWWLIARQYESTDDAYTDGHVVEVSSKVSGQVARVLVDDNDDVKQGQVLVELDARDFEAQRDQAAAVLKVNQAELARATAELARAKSVNERSSGAVSAEDLLADTAAAQKAEAAVEQAQQNLKAAELNLSYTKIEAPFSGRIARKAIEPGAYITPGQALLSVVDPRVWVTANFKETQLALMKVGDPVTVRIDAYPNLRLRAHVDSLQPGSGARFSLLPPENATGNFVKIVQRLPVKIVFDDYDPAKQPYLGVGLSCEPRVKVR